MYSKKKIVLVSVLALSLLALYSIPLIRGEAVIQSHKPTPFVIQGHSPVDLLVTDTNGLQTGCLNGQNLTNILGSTFSGCGTEPETVVISNPIPGIYTVQYVGTGSGTYTITTTTCLESNDDDKNQGQSEICGSGDPDDKVISALSISGIASPGVSGQTGYDLNSNGTLTQILTVPIALTLNPDSTSTSISSTNYFTVSYTANGAAKTAKEIGGLLNLQVDPNTMVTISGISSSSTSSEEWCFASGCGSLSFNSGPSGGSLSLVYYDVLSQAVADSIVGGGSPTVTLSYSGMPSTASSADSPTSLTATLTSTAQSVEALRGTTATVPSTIAGIVGEQWVTRGSTSWSITASNVVTNPVVYYHQFMVTFAQTGLDSSALGTVATAQGTAYSFSQLPVSVWVDVNALSYSYSTPVSSSVTGHRFRLASTSGPSSGAILTAPTTITGNYVLQYQVTFAIFPSGSGTTNPSTGAYWYDAGSTVAISAHAYYDNEFGYWQVSSTSIIVANVHASSTTVLINGPGTITARFFNEDESSIQVSSGQLLVKNNAIRAD